MPSAKLLGLKDRYQNGRDDIGRDLIAPCLAEAILYRRGTGFFSSSALIAYAGAMDHIISDSVKLEILCSPVIQDFTVVRQLEENSTSQSREERLQRLSENILLTALGYKLNPERRDYRQRLLSYLIASEQLEFRFGVPKGTELREGANPVNDSNLYHVKMGYFSFADGTTVAFDGSFNESDSGHRHHIDRAQVFRSWIAEDERRLNALREDVDYDWEGRNRNLELYRLSEQAIAIIKKLSPRERPHDISTRAIGVESTLVPVSAPPVLWPHQQQALERFLESGFGVLEMATGTGKTRTALELIGVLIKAGSIQTVIVSTYGTDLLNQWHQAINSWLAKRRDITAPVVHRAYEQFNEVQAFLNTPRQSLLIISREPERLRLLLTSTRVDWARTLVIHDEVHGIGSPGILAALSGTHAKIRYRLGLSATPEREYDEAGNKFIEHEIGPIRYQYPLESAIQDGVLCEFDYQKVPFALTEADDERRKAVYAREAAAKKDGNPWTRERRFTELARVVKSAVEKPTQLRRYLETDPDALKNTIVFVLDKEQGDAVCEVIRKFTSKYKTYYAGTEKAYIDALCSGQIDVLVACQRLNEGVDIRQLQTVILVASDRAKLDTIQRIGRCLRKDPMNPAKRAKVIDMVLESELESFTKSERQPDGEVQVTVKKADYERMEWLTAVSQTRFIGSQ
jgi:superfamily II DNA or RNA helicase